MIWTRAFWQAATERAIWTTAQAALGIIGATALLHEVDWPMVASAAGLAGVASLLKSVAATAATGSPSTGGGEVLEESAATGTSLEVGNGWLRIEGLGTSTGGEVLEDTEARRFRDDNHDGIPDIKE